jgi:hypothetical protein
MNSEDELFKKLKRKPLSEIAAIVFGPRQHRDDYISIRILYDNHWNVAEFIRAYVITFLREDDKTADYFASEWISLEERFLQIHPEYRNKK